MKITHLRTIRSRLHHALPHRILIVSTNQDPFCRLVTGHLNGRRYFKVLERRHHQNHPTRRTTTLRLNNLHRRQGRYQLTTTIATHGHVRHTDQGQHVRPTRRPATHTVMTGPTPYRNNDQPDIRFLRCSTSVHTQRNFQTILRQHLHRGFKQFIRFQAFFHTQCIPKQLRETRVILAPTRCSFVYASSNAPPRRIVKGRQLSATRENHVHRFTRTATLGPVHTHHVFRRQTQLIHYRSRHTARLAVRTGRHV